MAEALDAREDELDDQEDEKHRREERERKQREKLERAPKRLDEGGGMYLYERVYWTMRSLRTRITHWRQRNAQQQKLQGIHTLASTDYIKQRDGVNL